MNPQDSHPGHPVKEVRHHCGVCHVQHSYLTQMKLSPEQAIKAGDPDFANGTIWGCPDCSSIFREEHGTFTLLRHRKGDTPEVRNPQVGNAVACTKCKCKIDRDHDVFVVMNDNRFMCQKCVTEMEIPPTGDPEARIPETNATHCHDCKKVVYPLGTPESDAGKSLGYRNADENIRCKVCSHLFIDKEVKDPFRCRYCENKYAVANRKDSNGVPMCQTCYDQILAVPKQEMLGGMAHSVGTPPFHLIPSIALIELANQYALGESIKGKDAWNALSNNQHVLTDKVALAVRLGHVISHCTVMLDDLVADRPLNIRDAAAIMWGGSFAIASVDARHPQK